MIPSGQLCLGLLGALIFSSVPILLAERSGGVEVEGGTGHGQGLVPLCGWECFFVALPEWEV